MTNHMWRIGLDPDQEQFYCVAADGSPVAAPLGVDLDTDRRRSEMVAAAIKVANDRKLRIVSIAPWQNELWIALVGEFNL